MNTTSEAQIRSMVRDELALAARRGKVALVGERGPERFVPSTSVTAVPYSVDTRSPLEQTLDALQRAAEDLARAFRAHHVAMTEPLT